MDQMTSSLGEKDCLLTLRCQPAEVQAPLKIPHHICFWGVDSGIRHSVGGSDYSSVRTGAFMGLKIASSLATKTSRPTEEKRDFFEALGDLNPSLFIAFISFDI